MDADKYTRRSNFDFWLSLVVFTPRELWWNFHVLRKTWKSWSLKIHIGIYYFLRFHQATVNQKVKAWDDHCQSAKTLVDAESFKSHKDVGNVETRVGSDQRGFEHLLGNQSNRQRQPHFDQSSVMHGECFAFTRARIVQTIWFMKSRGTFKLIVLTRFSRLANCSSSSDDLSITRLHNSPFIAIKSLLIYCGNYCKHSHCIRWINQSNVYYFNGSD